MTVSKIDFNCPFCNKKNRVKIRNRYNEKDIVDIFNKNAFSYECIKCHKKTYLDYPFTFVTDKYAILYNTSDDIEENIIKRKCTTFDDAKEKILILNDGLNDVVIEYLKLFLNSRLKEENIISEIRYDSFDGKNIKFYIINEKKYAVIEIDYYNELLNKGRLKDIKESAMIDSNTCLKYFHL